jgi:hypothetical protein
MSNADDIYSRFRYCAPSPERVEQHQQVRSLVTDVAIALDEHVRDSREKSLMLTHLEEALFWANAAIARQPS